MTEETLLVKRDGDFQYPIYFEKDFSHLPQALTEAGLEGRRVCLVTDENVGRLYKEEVVEELKKRSLDVCVFTFPPGEQHKHLDTVKELYRFLIEQEMDRKCLLAALGGGVTGDLAGYGAATYLRGVDFIQIPTTLLAQVDSSVGGKTGVDFEQYKNMVGAFHQPRMVYMNMAVLKTLPEIEFSCGMGEVLKTGLICDGGFFRQVCQKKEEISQKDPYVLSSMIRGCCAIKAGVVERDPKEMGERALLNLGHTVGHAVEKLMDFQLLHGQCVGLGLVAAAFLSQKRGLLTPAETEEILKACTSFGLPLTVSGLKAEEILKATKKDKKMEQGKIKFILMDGIGKSFIDKSVTDQELLAGIEEICL